MQRERSRGELGRGVDDGLSKAFELTLTPAVLGGIGWLVDNRLEVTPLFTLVLTFLGVVGTSISAWYRYDDSMRACEADLAAARADRPRRPLAARAAATDLDAHLDEQQAQQAQLEQVAR